MTRVRKPSGNRLGVALAAALMLLLQTAAGAYALGTGAAAAPRDAFGNPLCITSGTHTGQDLPAFPAHSTLPGCCTLACSLGVALLGPGPEAAFVAVPLHASMLAKPLPVRARPVRLSEHSPANPRAPPLS